MNFKYHLINTNCNQINVLLTVHTPRHMYDLKTFWNNPHIVSTLPFTSSLRIVILSAIPTQSHHTGTTSQSYRHRVPAVPTPCSCRTNAVSHHIDTNSSLYRHAMSPSCRHWVHVIPPSSPCSSILCCTNSELHHTHIESALYRYKVSVVVTPSPHHTDSVPVILTQIEDPLYRYCVPVVQIVVTIATETASAGAKPRDEGARTKWTSTTIHFQLNPKRCWNSWKDHRERLPVPQRVTSPK